MEPGVYKSFTGLFDKIPPAPPIPNTENDTEEQRHSARESGQQSSSSTSVPAQSMPIDTNWTVYGLNVMRSNFVHTAVGIPENEISVGWDAPNACLEAAPALTRPGKMTSFGHLEDET